MIKNFNEYTQEINEIEQYLTEKGKTDEMPGSDKDTEEIPCSDKDGPCKGKPFNKIGSDGHLAAMQFHSGKFNAIKKGKEYSDAEHVQKSGMGYHAKMYNAHKEALVK